MGQYNPSNFRIFYYYIIIIIIIRMINVLISSNHDKKYVM